MDNFSKDTIFLVLASSVYDERDYLRNYDDFLDYIKILIVAQLITRYLNELSGSTTKVAHLVEELSSHCNVKLFCKDLYNPVGESVNHYQIANFSLPKSWPASHALAPKETSKQFLRFFNNFSNLTNENYDILHCHNLNSLLIANVYRDLIKKPIIFDSHGTPPSQEILFKKFRKNYCRNVTVLQ